MAYNKFSYSELVRQKRVTTVAGAWTFYFLTALIPIVFLLITAFGVFGVEFSGDLIKRLPEEFRLAGETILATAQRASGGITVFFIITVMLSGSALLSQMSKDGEFLYGLKNRRANGVMRRVWAIFALAALFIIFLAVAFLLSFRMPVKEFLCRDGKNIFFTVSIFLFTILLCYVIIVLLNKFISPVRQRFGTLALGSFISLAADVAGTIGFIFYLKYFANYNAFYGSLAAVIVFILWAYVIMTGLAIGVTVNVFLFERAERHRSARKKKRHALKSAATASENGAYSACQAAEDITGDITASAAAYNKMGKTQPKRRAGEAVKQRQTDDSIPADNFISHVAPKPQPFTGKPLPIGGAKAVKRSGDSSAE